MFGEETGAPTARLFGHVMEALVLAIPEIESRTDRPVMAHAWAVDRATPMSIEVFNADASPARIRQDAALHARKWFVDQRVNTVQRINAVSPGDEIDMDTVGLVADLLLGELEQ